MPLSGEAAIGATARAGERGAIIAGGEEEGEAERRGGEDEGDEGICGVLISLCCCPFSVDCDDIADKCCNWLGRSCLSIPSTSRVTSAAIINASPSASVVECKSAAAVGGGSDTMIGGVRCSGIGLLMFVCCVFSLLKNCLIVFVLFGCVVCAAAAEDLPALCRDLFTSANCCFSEARDCGMLDSKVCGPDRFAAAADEEEAGAEAGAAAAADGRI